MRTSLSSLRVVAAALAVSLLALPTSGRAATADPTGAATGIVSSGTSTTTVLVLTGIAILGGAIYGSYTSTTKKDEREERKEEKKDEVKKAEREALGRAVKGYLAANQLQMRQDLAVGAGPFVKDLAAAAEIRADSLDRFGAVLRANRAELLVLGSNDGLTSDRALAFLSRVGELVKADAELNESYLSFAKRYDLAG